eukprot:5886487-Alexandrium_andersonii.AAC.1
MPRASFPCMSLLPLATKHRGIHRGEGAPLHATRPHWPLGHVSPSSGPPSTGTFNALQGVNFKAARTTACMPPRCTARPLSFTHVLHGNQNGTMWHIQRERTAATTPIRLLQTLRNESRRTALHENML